MAFAFCYGLETVVIPKSVTEIKELAFEDCHKLKNIIILNDDVKIYDKSFQGVSGLCKKNDYFNKLDSKELQRLFGELPKYFIFSGVIDETSPAWKNLISAVKRDNSYFIPNWINLPENKDDSVKNAKLFLSLWKKVPLDKLDACIETSAFYGQIEANRIYNEYKARMYP